MKSRIASLLKTTLALSFVFAALGCSIFPKEPEIDHRNKLILVTGASFEVGDLTKALDSIIDVQSGNNKQNIVIFVHGRGGGRVKHPEKAIKQMLPFIESEYGTRVVLFNWKGSEKGGKLGFPEEEARAASGDLFKVLTQLAEYKHKKSDQLTGVRFALLTHSMGSLVVEETVAKHFRDINLNPGLLDVLVLSASASKSKGHSKWLDKAELANQVFVTLNSKDSPLGMVSVGRGRRLGKGLKKSETSVRAQYIDVSNTGVNHRYFIAHTKNGGNNGQKGNPCISEFYKAALNGTPVDLSNFQGIQEVRQERVFVMKTATGDKCR